MKKLLVVFILFSNSALISQETFVMVHGAWGGGWIWKDIDRSITEAGHLFYRPTLTGLGEKRHLASRDINVTTHIDDVVNLILFEDLDDIILLGHSYGGMIITGVANKVPDRIKKIVYLDAFLPKNGESIIEFERERSSGPGIMRMEKDGFLVPPWVKPDQKLPHDVPHPVGTLEERIVLDNPKRLQIPGLYVLFVAEDTAPENDSHYESYQRAMELNYQGRFFTSDHNAQWSKPKDLLALLLSLAK